MKCKECGKEFEGNEMVCDECVAIPYSTENDGEDMNSEQKENKREDSNLKEEDAKSTASGIIYEQNNGGEKHSEISKKKKMVLSIIFGILLIFAISLFVKSPTAKIMRNVADDKKDEAVQIYSKLSEKEKNKVNEKIMEECTNLIDEYNDEHKSYEEISKTIQSLCTVVSDVSECKAELNKLYASKKAFEKGKEFTEKSEWLSAKIEFEKVIETDKKYSEAVSAIENCDRNISLNHFKNGVQFESENKWAEAIDEYEQVSEITADEYSKATTNKTNCIENLRSTVNPKLDQLYAEGKYEEGLSLIATAEKHIQDDATLQSHKTNFTQKKQEEDRIREENKYNTGITYDQLARYPDDYKGKYVKFKGKVLQVQSSGFITVYRIGTSGRGYYDNVLYVTQLDTNTKNRILEDDIVTIKGKSTGLYTYETVMGNSITIPSISLDSIER